MIPHPTAELHQHERTHQRRAECTDCQVYEDHAEDLEKIIQAIDHFEGPGEHMAHVMYVREMIERRKRREELVDKIFQTTIGNLVWVAIVGLGLLGYNLLKYVVAYAAKTGKLPGS